MSTATQVAEATNHVRNNAQHDIHADNAFAFAADVLVAEGKRDQEIAESYVANSQAALADTQRVHVSTAVLRVSGMPKRLRPAIERAMVAQPKLLLADEPTGALDTASGAQIMDIFEKLNAAGTTIVMITHEPEIAKRAGYTMYIRDGVLSGERKESAGL